MYHFVTHREGFGFILDTRTEIQFFCWIESVKSPAAVGMGCGEAISRFMNRKVDFQPRGERLIVLIHKIQPNKALLLD